MWLRLSYWQGHAAGCAHLSRERKDCSSSPLAPQLPPPSPRGQKNLALLVLQGQNNPLRTYTAQHLHLGMFAPTSGAALSMGRKALWEGKGKNATAWEMPLCLLLHSALTVCFTVEDVAFQTTRSRGRITYYSDRSPVISLPPPKCHYPLRRSPPSSLGDQKAGAQAR